MFGGKARRISNRRLGTLARQRALTGTGLKSATRHESHFVRKIAGHSVSETERSHIRARGARRGRCLGPMMERIGSSVPRTRAADRAMLSWRACRGRLAIGGVDGGW